MTSKRLIQEFAIKQLEEAFDEGCTIALACEYARIGKATYYRIVDDAIKLLEQDPPPEVHSAEDEFALEFYHRMNIARYKSSRISLRAIRDAAEKGQWQAAAWLLERSRPNEYGRKVIETNAASTKEFNISFDMSGKSNPTVIEVDD